MLIAEQTVAAQLHNQSTGFDVSRIVVDYLRFQVHGLFGEHPNHLHRFVVRLAGYFAENAVREMVHAPRVCCARFGKLCVFRGRHVTGAGIYCMVLNLMKRRSPWTPISVVFNREKQAHRSDSEYLLRTINNSKYVKLHYIKHHGVVTVLDFCYEADE